MAVTLTYFRYSKQNTKEFDSIYNALRWGYGNGLQKQMTVESIVDDSGETVFQRGKYSIREFCKEAEFDFA